MQRFNKRQSTAMSIEK